MLSAPTLAQLKDIDPDRLRAAVLGSKGERESLELLYAFHYELAKVPELVSEPMIGQIRYQWWRDVLAEIYEGKTVRSHEITTPLEGLLKQADVPRFWCDRLIDGRERDLDPTPFANLAETKDYCRQTSGTLMQIAVKCLGAEPNEAALDFTVYSNALRENEPTFLGLTGLYEIHSELEDIKGSGNHSYWTR